MSNHYNHRWLGDAEEQRPLHQPYLHQQPPPPSSGGYSQASHPGPVGPIPYYTGTPDYYNAPRRPSPELPPHLLPAVSSPSSSFSASSTSGGRPVTPPVSAPSAYAHNPDDLFRTTTTAGGGGSYHPQQQQHLPFNTRVPVEADGAAYERVDQWHQTRLRNARVVEQQRTIQESNHKHFPFFLLLASIAQCVLMGVAIWKNGGFEPISVNPFFGPDAETLIALGAKDVPKIVEDYEVWRFFTPIFLHAGLIHLALNLIFQLQCFMLERQMGFVRVGLVYIVSGFGGNLASSLFLPRLISVGASGALFGLVGMIFVVIFRNWSLVVSPCRNLVVLCIMVAISLFLGLLPNVDNFAHVGGLVTGLVASLIVVPSLKHGAKAGPFRLLVASVALLVLAAGLGLGVYALFEDVPLREWCSFCSLINCVDFGQDWCVDQT
ncbi:peptidase, S54 family protein [Acanthamoeba castellanii str. Neff]|uniref:rhomboid protease n=1 Tax=Acanthamoeba castellanii (strain ATCC 30010 / Neff) TaxID=1257118 RepID=L8GPZ4_ACACF|nr:peptidase, S54 family protein [Acanthamoeba castellanii str. Neff]ELR15060.1 peptidase, S54 family protein [Acanthamoeba castellanii str. Neff]